DSAAGHHRQTVDTDGISAKRIRSRSMGASDEEMDKGRKLTFVRGDDRPTGVGKELSTGRKGSAEIAAHTQPLVDVHGGLAVKAASIGTPVEAGVLITAEHFWFRRLLRETH